MPRLGTASNETDSLLLKLVFRFRVNQHDMHGSGSSPDSLRFLSLTTAQMTLLGIDSDLPVRLRPDVQFRVLGDVEVSTKRVNPRVRRTAPLPKYSGTAETLVHSRIAVTASLRIAQQMSGWKLQGPGPSYRDN